MKQVLKSFLLIFIAIASYWDVRAQSSKELNCRDLYLFAHYEGMAGNNRVAFDTMKHYIEQCHSESESFRGFIQLGHSLQGLLEPWEKKGPEYREWLKTVLFLNKSEPRYYCTAISSLFVTFQNHEPNQIRDFNAIIALMDYMLDRGGCPEYEESYLEERAYFRTLQHRHWADSVQDSIATPLDTTAVTLEEIGLDWIRGSSSVEVDGSSITYLGNIVVSNNPFRKSTEFTLEMLRDGHARIEIYDMLGRQHFDIGNFKRFGEGKHLIELPDDLPSGTLLLQVSTPGGEIQTIQLKKLD